MSEVLAGGSPLDKSSPPGEITQFERRVAAAVNNPTVHMLLVDAFKEYMTQYLALNQPPLSINQIFGFQKFTPQTAVRVNVSESTVSTSYVDLATVGPQLTGLPPGRYSVWFGAQAGGNSALMTVKDNAVAATDADSILISLGAGSVSAAGYRDVSLTEESNTLKCVYRATAGTASFDRRWLVAIRYANS